MVDLLIDVIFFLLIQKQNRLIITHLIIPQQYGTPDSCATTNEEDLFSYQTEHDLITLGWIHVSKCCVRLVIRMSPLKLATFCVTSRHILVKQHFYLVLIFILITRIKL